jgi:hypothetical protein
MLGRGELKGWINGSGGRIMDCCAACWGSSDQSWREGIRVDGPRRDGGRRDHMTDPSLIETSAAKDREVDCLTVRRRVPPTTRSVRGVCGTVQREITRAPTNCEVWLRRSAGTRPVKL